MEKGPGPDGSYWVIGCGSYYLGEGIKYSKSLAGSRKFTSLENAEEFAFDGRKKMGGTFFQKVSRGPVGKILGSKIYCKICDGMREHLGLKHSSVMDNTLLLKLSVQKFG